MEPDDKKDPDLQQLEYFQSILESNDNDAHLKLFLGQEMKLSFEQLNQGYAEIKSELDRIKVNRPEHSLAIVKAKGSLLEMYRNMISSLDVLLNGNRSNRIESADENNQSELETSEDEIERNSTSLLSKSTSLFSKPEEETTPKARPLKKRRFSNLPLNRDRKRTSSPQITQVLQQRRQSKRQAAKAALDIEKQTICASGELCKMPPNTPLDGKHKCKTCELLLHGCMCRVPQTEFEEDENICYCLKCGRPGENDPPPPPKLPPPPPKLPPPPPTTRRSKRRIEKATSSISKRGKNENPYAKSYKYNTDAPRAETSKRTTQKEAAASVTAGAKNFACAAEELCQLPNTPLKKPYRRCMECRGKVHGGRCCVKQLPNERGNIYYCRKCGRPKTETEPKSKRPRKTKGLPTLASTKTPNQINGKNRRSVKSQPRSVSCLKDRTVRAKAKVCANHVAGLQFCNTFPDKKSRDFWPKSQHFMYTYDELVEKPHFTNIPRRDDPVHIFLAPKGVDEKVMGTNLISIGQEMKKKSGKNYIFTNSQDEYITLVFGEKQEGRKAKKKAKKKSGKK